MLTTVFSTVAWFHANSVLLLAILAGIVSFDHTLASTDTFQANSTLQFVHNFLNGVLRVARVAFRILNRPELLALLDSPSIAATALPTPSPTPAQKMAAILENAPLGAPAILPTKLQEMHDVALQRMINQDANEAKALLKAP